MNGTGCCSGQNVNSRKSIRIKYGQLEDLPEYMKVGNREDLRTAVAQDPDIPAGLRELILDTDFWAVFKPTGSEIYAIIQKFGMFTEGRREHFAEALRLVRAFLAA